MQSAGRARCCGRFRPGQGGPPGRSLQQPRPGPSAMGVAVTSFAGCGSAAPWRPRSLQPCKRPRRALAARAGL
eukprot:6871612-Lingulodinium_polyedra.AAC.1